MFIESVGVSDDFVFELVVREGGWDVGGRAMGVEEFVSDQLIVLVLHGREIGRVRLVEHEAARNSIYFFVHGIYLVQLRDHEAQEVALVALILYLGLGLLVFGLKDEGAGSLY